MSPCQLQPIFCVLFFCFYLLFVPATQLHCSTQAARLSFMWLQHCYHGNPALLPPSLPPLDVVVQRWKQTKIRSFCHKSQRKTLKARRYSLGGGSRHSPSSSVTSSMAMSPSMPGPLIPSITTCRETNTLSYFCPWKTRKRKKNTLWDKIRVRTQSNLAKWLLMKNNSRWLVFVSVFNVTNIKVRKHVESELLVVKARVEKDTEVQLKL